MPIQTINIGNYSNDGTGDDLRTAFEKVNANFSLLNTQDTTAAANLGAGQGVFAQKSGATLQFKSLVAGTNITLAADGNTITINGQGNLQTETAPTLGANLNMNGFNIVGGGNIVANNIEALIYGVDVRTLAGTGGDLDFGTFAEPGTADINLGTFID